MRNKFYVLPCLAALFLGACGVPSDADEDADLFAEDDTESSAAELASAPHRPNAITAVTSTPGPKPGEVTVRWTHDGKYTTGFVLETGLTTFSKTNPDLPVSGRNAKFFKLAAKARTVTLTAAQVASAGAPLASGNHLYFRLSAVNKDSKGTSTRYYPYLSAVLPLPVAPKAGYGKLRVASFNVRTARALTDARRWLERAPDVAAQIVQYAPGIVAIQECGPGRADGVAGATNGDPRQTDSLETALDAANGSRYRFVQRTPYVSAGTAQSTQGMRILYDTTRFTLLSPCSDKTDGRAYSGACSFEMPLLSTDAETVRRRAAFAKFEDRASGKRFWFVSVHLDERHEDDLKKEAVLDGLRKRQADTIAAQMAARNTENLPLIVAGDFNTWQNNKGGNSAHDTLIAQGYADSFAAVRRKNEAYATISHFDLTMKRSAQGVGSRIDWILMKGAQGASYFENVMKVTDPARPSDHNMIVADIAPFAP